MPRQLVFELPHRSASGREDFLIAPSNQAAVGMIDAWPDWVSNALLISGPAGSGKTHLADVWQRSAVAHRIDASELHPDAIAELSRRKAIVVEDLGELTGEGERALFHLINAIKEEGGFLLLTSRKAPGHLSVRLPDLASRLRAMPHAELGPPDDALLAGILAKLFEDRQLQVPEALIPYLASRIERSVAAAKDVVERLDQASLSGKRSITVKLAGEILSAEND